MSQEDDSGIRALKALIEATRRQSLQDLQNLFNASVVNVNNRFTNLQQTIDSLATIPAQEVPPPTGEPVQAPQPAQPQPQPQPAPQEEAIVEEPAVATPAQIAQAVQPHDLAVRLGNLKWYNTTAKDADYKIRNNGMFEADIRDYFTAKLSNFQQTEKFQIGNFFYQVVKGDKGTWIRRWVATGVAPAATSQPPAPPPAGAQSQPQAARPPLMG
jgi:hypothetical protein